MAQFYKVLKADPLGEPWTPNAPGAKPVQNYWCQLEGLDKDVSIGKQVRDDGRVALSPGQHVYGDLVYAKSQKGTEYWRFKSVQVPEDVQRPADSPAQATAQAATTDMSATQPAWFTPWANVLLDIQKDLKLLKGDDIPDNSTEEVAAEEKAEEGVEQLAGEPLDADTKKALDDIFTPPEVPEDK